MDHFGALALSGLFILFASLPTARAQVRADVAADKTPVVLDPLAGHKALSGSRAWRSPDFTEQDGSLGWSPKAFEVPPGLEKQVAFWVDVYTRYSTSQGIIHDSENIDLIYEIVDFRDVEKSILTDRDKTKLRRKMVEDAKLRAISALEKVASSPTPIDLTPAERRIWAYFEGKDAPAQLRAAASPGRIRFQLGQKDRMESAIFLSGRYLETFEDVFREAGLPIELTRLVFVESSFNVLARSKVGASGLWQLMPGTVRPYKIVHPAVDGRNHPLTATRIAARILADNYRKLGSWPLALTGYNHGPAGVAQIVGRYGTTELPELVKNVRSRASFGFASRNFYASFLAAYEVEKNAAKYFPNIVWSRPLEGEEFKLPQAAKYADLLTWFDHDDVRLQLMNPHLTSLTRKGYAIPAGTPVMVPFRKYNQALLSLGRGSRAAALRDSAKTRNVAAKPAARKPASKTHRVNRGENLTAIARAYDIGLNDLLKANGLRMNGKIVPGQKLRIPRPTVHEASR